MEAPSADHAKREAVVLTGLPLLALSFQTLGMISVIPHPQQSRNLTPLQGLSIPILALSAWVSSRGFRFRSSCSSPRSTCLMVSGHRPHLPRTLLVV